LEQRRSLAEREGKLMEDGDYFPVGELQKCQESNWANRRRADAAEGQLARLTALLEDRTTLTQVLIAGDADWTQSKDDRSLYEHQADRLIAYLKPLG
jgi:hypothetical protein